MRPSSHKVLGLLLLLVVTLIVGTLAGGEPQTPLDDETLAESVGYTARDVELMRRALDQTPAEDRHLILKRVLRLGILSAILATPALAASLLPLALVPLILISKHKQPPINVIPLPPIPPTEYYPQQAYPQPQQAYPQPQPQAYSPAPPASSPPQDPPQPQPQYSPPSPTYSK